MKLNEVRKKYLDFFRDRGHTIIPSASLVPENDPTTLFTGSGMQPLLPYLLGAPHPEGRRLVDSQKSFRSMDIEEVGDNRHTTFFEMLGNWSLGDYFKEEQLPWFFEFLTKEIGLDPKKLYVTVFDGAPEIGISRDEESIKIWQELFSDAGVDNKFVPIGSEAKGYEVGMQGGRIFSYDAKKNWWSRAGVPQNMPSGEPGGPDSEVFYDFETPHDPKWGAECHPNCDCGRFMEIGNSVFMQFIKNTDGSFSDLPQKNVDFGGGLERITAASANNQDVFLTEGLWGIINQLDIWVDDVKKRYVAVDNKISFRVVSDHIRGAIFMIADGVLPSNTDRGYFLRRLIRRSVLHADKLSVPENSLYKLIPSVIEAYRDAYPKLEELKTKIAEVIENEERRFRETLIKGLREFEKIGGKTISGRDAFVLFSTYGFPFEMTREIAAERQIEVDEIGFKEEMLKHQELSRVGSEQKFKGGLADSNEKTTMLHTVTHLMLAGLRKYLGEHVHQAGSNITEERTRFDFTHGEKVSREILDKVESYVNEAISKKAMVKITQMKKEEAKTSGVEGSFWEKYPNIVNVYEVKAEDGTIYSRELCGGPHVKDTGSIRGTFKIIKEEAVSAGVRRIKAVLS